MSQLTICQSPFGLKPSLSGKCSGFRNPSPQGGRWGSLLCLHGKEEWSQTSSCRLLGALGVHTGPAGSRTFPVLLVLAQLASAPGNFRPLFSQFSDGLLGLSFESTQLVPRSLLKSGCNPHVLLAWTSLGCRVILLHPDNPSDKLTIQQVSYFPVPSLAHPGTSEYFPYKKEISGDQLRPSLSLTP